MLDANTTGEIFDISKRVYDLGDTALKIGVPIFFSLITSLVTWFFTFKSTKKNHEHELIKLEKNYAQEITKLEKNQKHEIEKLEKNYENDINKTKLQMKIKTIENTIEIADNYFKTCGEYVDLFFNCSDLNETIAQFEKNHTELFKKYSRLRTKYVEDTAIYRTVHSKFVWLGFNNTAKELSKIQNIIAEEHNRLTNVEEMLMDNEKYEEFNKKYQLSKKAYYIAITKDFEQLK